MIRASTLCAGLRRLTTALASQVSASVLRQMAVDEALSLTSASSTALCLLDSTGEILDFVAAAGHSADEIIGIRMRVADSLSDPVVSTGSPLLVDNRSAPHTPSLFPAAEEPARAGAALRLGGTPGLVAAVVPLRDSGRVVGALCSLRRGAEGPAFDQDDLDILALIADFATAAATAHSAQRTIRSQTREIAVMRDAADSVAGRLNIQEVLDGVLTALCKNLDYHTAALFLLNDERTHLFIAAERGLTPEGREVQLSAARGVQTRALDLGLALLIEDAETIEDFLGAGEDAAARSILIAPIRSCSDTHGILVLTSLQAHGYHEEDRHLVEAVAGYAGMAIENAWLYADAQRHAEELTALCELSQHLNATLQLNPALECVADCVMTLFRIDRFALMLYDPREERLVARVCRNLPDAEFRAAPLRSGEGIAGWVFEAQSPQAVSDVPADARDRSAPLGRFGVASVLCTPMLAGDQVVGVILAMSSNRRQFTVPEMALLYTISNQAASAVANATHYHEARSRSLEVRRQLRRVAHAIGQSLEARDLPQLLADLAREFMRADRCAIYRLDGDTLSLRAASGFRASLPPDARVGLGEGLCGWVARRGQSLPLRDLDADARSAAHAWLGKDHLGSYLGVPIKQGYGTMGVVEIYTQEQRTFSKEEVELLSTFMRRARVVENLESPGA